VIDRIMYIRSHNLKPDTKYRVPQKSFGTTGDTLIKLC
jgi:hypothetical protein